MIKKIKIYHSFTTHFPPFAAPTKFFLFALVPKFCWSTFCFLNLFSIFSSIFFSRCSSFRMRLSMLLLCLFVVDWSKSVLSNCIGSVAATRLAPRTRRLILCFASAVAFSLATLACSSLSILSKLTAPCLSRP